MQKTQAKQPLVKDMKNTTKMKYMDIIVEAIFVLNDREGSSREAIWKYIQAKHQNTVRDKKIFLSHLKRAADEGEYVEHPSKKIGRFKLTKKFREFVRNKVMKGETTLNLKKMHVMLKPTKPKAKKPTKAKTLKKNKANKSKKGKETRKKANNKKADAKASKR